MLVEAGESGASPVPSLPPSAARRADATDALPSGPCSAILTRVSLSRTFAFRRPPNVRISGLRSLWPIDRRRPTRDDIDAFPTAHATPWIDWLAVLRQPWPQASAVAADWQRR